MSARKLPCCTFDWCPIKAATWVLFFPEAVISKQKYSSEMGLGVFVSRGHLSFVTLLEGFLYPGGHWQRPHINNYSSLKIPTYGRFNWCCD